MAEELFKSLTGRESVHLCDWPPAGQTNGIILQEMATVRELITQGLAQRAAAGVRVRQPLSKVTVSVGLELKPELLEIIAEELNVKEVVEGVSATDSQPAAQIDLEITAELKREGLARELIRHIQNARKNAGLNVDDRISLRVEVDGETAEAFNQFKDEIYRETLATAELDGEPQHNEEVKLDGQGAKISLSKA
jgi:isoleucyl-tRNA synthetase